MDDYIKQLEIRNEELQNSLTKTLSDNQKLNQIIENRTVFSIGVTSRINSLVFDMLIVDTMYYDKLLACKYLYKNWKSLKLKYKNKYVDESCYRYFFISPHIIHDKIITSLPNSVAMAFETKNDLKVTIKRLEDDK